MSTFIAKLNYKEEGYHLTQTFTVDSSTESVTIEHDYPTNIVIVDELDRVKVSNVDYSLVPTEGKPWEINIIPIGDYTTPETWTIEYESTGDENDADDINEVVAHEAEHSYLQEEEPTNVNPTTLWFAIGSEVNFSGGGVAIQNAETSDTPPETNIWFKPI